MHEDIQPSRQRERSRPGRWSPARTRGACGPLGALAASLIAAAVVSPAQALTFQFGDSGGAGSGSAARQGFEIAAGYWSSVISSQATVALDIGFRDLGRTPGGRLILGASEASLHDVQLSAVAARLSAAASSDLDVQAMGALPPQISAGAISAITHSALNGPGGVDTRLREWDADGSANNRVLYGESSLFKALGLTIDDRTGEDFSQVTDGAIVFSSQANFDFDPTDGIGTGEIDFVATAIHEIGHALGFRSGVDILDAYGYPNGAWQDGQGTDFDRDFGGVMSILDLFRYSADPYGVAPGAGPALDWSIADAADIASGGSPYFSIDGGASQLFGASGFSTGQFNGDGFQASHWKNAEACGDQLGLLDPTICRGGPSTVTALDLAAMDAIGWNLALDILKTPEYRKTTADIYRDYFAAPPGGVVPEPSAWALMIMGFGAIGAALRHRGPVAQRVAAEEA